MVHIDLETEGNSVILEHAKIRKHPKISDVEMAHMHFDISGVQLAISFATWAEMIDFCKKHNFEYEDAR